MTVRQIDQSTIALEGICPLAEAELLRQMLVSTKSATVDWRACEQAHTAVVQVLLASRVELRGPPKSAFLRKVLEPRTGAPKTGNGYTVERSRSSDVAKGRGQNGL